MIIDSGIVTGSLQVSGSFSVQGATILSGGLSVAGGITGSISGSSATAVSASYALSASFATTAGTTINAPYYVLTASYNTDSASFSTRITNNTATGSNLTTASASFSTRVTTIEGQYATTGSNVFTGTNSFNIVSASFINALSASIDYLSVIYQTSSIVFSSGSNILGDSANDTQTLWGTIDMKTGPVKITGSVVATNSITASQFLGSGSSQFGALVTDSTTFYGTVDIKNGPVLVTGSLKVTQTITASGINVLYGITGDLIGTASTASYVNFAQTASLALTAQSAQTASYVQQAQSASYVQNAQTASFVQQAQNAYTASYVNFAQTASLAETALNAQTASYVTTAQTASYVQNAQSASYVSIAQTASYVNFAQTASLAETALNANTASYVSFAQTASYVANAVSASRASSALSADTASFVNFAQTASYVANAQSASFVQQAQNAYTASYVQNAQSASYVSIAQTASYVNFAQTASYVEVAQTASFVQQAQNAFSASRATSALNADTASYVVNAISSSNARTAITASYAPNYMTMLNPTYSGVLTFGTMSFTPAGAVAQFQSSLNNYNQILLQNSNGSNVASSDFVVNNDVSTDTDFYGDFGINSSGFTGVGSFAIPSATYLYAQGGDLVIGTTTKNTVRFVTSASVTTDILTLTGSSAIVTGIAQISGSLDVNGGITGSLLGTATTASYVLQAVSSSFASTAAYVLQAVSSSFASTASYLNPLNQNIQLTGSLTASANIWANKFVFTDGVVNTNNNGQLMLAANGNYMYLYTGTNGLYINNQANNANNVIIGDAGTVQTRGALTVGAPGNNQNIIFGGSDAKLDWAGTGAQILYSVGALQFSSVGATNNMILQQNGGALFNSGITGSLQATNGVISSSLQLANAGFATTGSNTFTGTQYISNTTNAVNFTSTASLYTDGGLRVGKDSYVSGGLYVAGDLTVYGTSSISYVTTSVFVGLEYINLNTDLPALRYAGINVGDSGSAAGVSSSFWYDSEKDNWLFVYAAPAGQQTSSLVINGPIAYSNVGNEQGLLGNYIVKSQLITPGNNHHITSSQIYDDGTTVAIAGNLQVTGSLRAGNLTGSLNGSNLVDGTVTNAKLANSTISGIALGSNLAALTIGTGLSGTSYNGSTGVTIANTGVTSFNTRTGEVTLQASDISGLGAGIFSGSAQIPNSSITSAQLATSSLTVTAGTGLSGGGSVSLGGSVTLTNAGVTSNVAGTGISVSGATGAVTITNTGVTSNVAGTGVSVSAGTGAVTISIGQAVATSSNVQFNSLGVGTAGSGTAGEIRATADITAFYSSDERLKEDITPIENPIEKLMAISGVTFNWKEGFDEVHSHKGADTGVIAQQIEAINLPDTVNTRENGYKAVRYEKLNALLIEGFKAQQTELNALKLEIEDLKAKLK